MHPVLFKAGNYSVYSYGVMMLAGFLATLYVAYRLAESAGFKKEDAVDMTIFVFISGIIGARLVHVLLKLNHFLTHPDKILDFQGGGLAWHGGLIGGVLCIWIYTKIKGYSTGQGFDLVYTGAILGLAFGRVGCFLNGCCYGKPCTLPWAVTFPSHAHPQAVHPTQLYELVLDVALFFFLLYWWKKRKFAGENILLMFSLYSVIRFTVEFFRYNSPNLMHYGLSVAQWASIVIFVVFLSIVVVKRKRLPDDAEPEIKHPQMKDHESDGDEGGEEEKEDKLKSRGEQAEDADKKSVEDEN